MIVMRRFEENLEYLGFELSPVAWDLAKIPFETDEDRMKVVQALSGRLNDGS